MNTTKPAGGKTAASGMSSSDAPTSVPTPLASFCQTFAKDANQVLNVDTKGNGLGIEINNGVTKDFRLRHTFDLKRREYGFLSQLQRDQTTWKGMASSSGWLTALVKHRWSDCLTTAVNSEFNCVSSESHTAIAATYLLGQGAGQLQFEQQKGESFVATGDLVYRVADGVSLGGQMQFDRQQSLAGGKAVAAAVAMQYEHPLFTGTGTFTTQGVIAGHIARRVCHYNKPGEDNVGLAAEINYDTSSGRSSAKVGAHFLLPHTKSQVHAAIDGTGKFSVSVHERLADWMILQLSSEMDHNTCDYLFGIGIQIGPSATSKPKEFQPLPVRRWQPKRMPERYE